MTINQASITKKAQAEAIGLVFIVLLVFVIIIIVAKLEDSNPRTNIREAYEVTELSSSTMNTFLATNQEDCYGKTYAEILVDCLTDEESRCDRSGRHCDVFYNDAHNLLNALFSEDKLNMHYEMTIASTGYLPSYWDEDGDKIIDYPISEGSCSDAYRGEDFILPIRSGAETATITLVVCHPN